MTVDPKGIDLKPPMNLYVTSEPQYFRILFTQDFHVHRTKPAQKDLRDRHKKAHEICPYWYKDANTSFLTELDRIIIISDEGLDEPNSEIVALTQKRHPSYVQTTATFEKGPRYDLIHDWKSHYTKPEDRPSWHESVNTHGYYKEPELAYEYQDKYPTAYYGLALRNTKRPRHKE